MTLDTLPLEIQILILNQVPDTGLKLTLKYWYLLYNDLFYHKLIDQCGEDIIRVIIKVLPWLKVYIKLMDAFRLQSRLLLANFLKLEDSDDENASNPFHCTFIKDLWRYIYLVFKNKRLFANHEDYNVDMPNNYVYRHYVEVNQLYLLSYKKVLWLAPGKYNLNIALVVNRGLGLGTTKFQVRYLENDGGVGKMAEQTFYPPVNIKDILPKNQFCLLRLGEFEIPKTGDGGALARISKRENKMVRVKFVMEELGLYLKLGFLVFFIDITQQTTLFNDYDLLYYLLPETNYKYFVNLPLKNLYRAIEYVQMGYHGEMVDNEVEEMEEVVEEGDSDDENDQLQLGAAPVSAMVRQQMGFASPERPRPSPRPRPRTILDATQDIAWETREFEQAVIHYGDGDPGIIPDEYDLGFLNDKEIDVERNEIRKVSLKSLILCSLWLLLLLNHNLAHSTPPPGNSLDELVELGHDMRDLLIKAKQLPGLMRYANFFFNNRYKRRYFKFNTVYQQRQFVNRFGDFTWDLEEEGGEQKCLYDKEGLRWKIPILGEL